MTQHQQNGYSALKALGLIFALAASAVTIGGQLIVYGEMRNAVAEMKETVNELKNGVNKISDRVADHETRITVMEHGKR